MSNTMGSAIEREGIDMRLLESDQDGGRNVDKKMSLASARSEMQDLGFDIVFDEETPSSDMLPSSTDVVVGVNSSCRSDMMAKMDVVLFVHHIKEGNLTLARVEQDFQGVTDKPYLDDVWKGCPPQGASRGRMIVLTYLVDNRIDSDAMSRILAAPNKEWCQTRFLAAQDGTGKSYFFEGSPAWGKALFPELRYYAGRMTGRQVPFQQSAMMPFLRLMNVFFVVVMVLGLFVNPIPIISGLVAVLLLFLAMWARQVRQQFLLKQRRNRNE